MASRILLADDSITIQKVVNLTFADEGIEVVAVSNGDIAEKRLAEVSPDLVLADIFMPGKNGYELCETIKESSQFRNVPVVLLVGAFEPFDQVEARRVRADAHLTKPFESRTLVETVRRLISSSWRTTTGPIAPTAAADAGYDEASDAGASLVATQLAGIDLSAMTATVAPPIPQIRNTGELGSPSPEIPQDVLDLGPVDAAALSSVSEPLTDTIERFEPLELSSNGDSLPTELASPLDIDVTAPHEECQILETHDFEPTPLQEAFPFDTMQPSALHEVNISGAGEGEHWFSSGGLEMSSVDPVPGNGVRQTSDNGSVSTFESPDYTMHSDASSALSETTKETACATLLAVDDPLGDVLFDEGAPLATIAPMEAQPLVDSPGLEMGEAEVAPVESASTQFDLVEIIEAPPSDAPAALETSETAPEASAPVESTAQTSEESVEPVKVEEAPVYGDTFATVAVSEHQEPESVPEQDIGNADWTTPHAASYSTAQLDSVVMPIEAAEYLAKQTEVEEPQPADQSDEASFTRASWTQEEARFTPIDVEAVAVDSFSATESPAAAEAEEELPVEKPAAPAEEVTALTAESVTSESPAVALSPAAIEQIVRRVVAEMSESVVREVAWEVVPDCVERVIEQLTRESLSKRV